MDLSRPGNLTNTQVQGLLDKLPYELKRMVFKCVFEDAPEGKTPALLVALRGSQDMYKDALKVYYQVTTVNLGRPKKESINSYSLKGLHLSTLSFVTRLDVTIKGNMWELRPVLERTARQEMLDLVNLREVILDFTEVHQNFHPNYPHVVQQWVHNFTKLQKITIKPNYGVKEAPDTVPVSGVEVPRPPPRVIEALNRALSVPGKLASVIGLNASCKKTPELGYSFRREKGFLLYRVYRSWLPSRSVLFHNIWFWEAEPGKTLAWTGPVPVVQPHF